MGRRSGWWLMCACCFALALPVAGQVTQLLRYEREVKSADEPFTIIPIGPDGIVLLRDKQKYEEGRRLWELVLLDAQLTERWNTELRLENRLELAGYDAWQGKVSMLFRYPGNESGEITLLVLDRAQLSIQRHVVRHEVNFTITHYISLSDRVVFGGYVNNEASVFEYDLTAEQFKVLPGFFLGGSQLLDLRANENNTFNTVLIERKTQVPQKRLTIKTFDEEGTLLLDDAVEIPEDRVVLSAFTSTLQRDELLIIGTWGTGQLRQAHGIFSFVVDPFRTQKKIAFFDFAQFPHFLDHLSARRAAKVRAHSARKRASGRIPDFRAYVNPVRLAESAEGFELFVEVFQPQSPSINNNPYGYYGNPYRFNNFNNFNSFNSWYPYGSGFYPSPYLPSTRQDVSAMRSDARMLAGSLFTLSPAGIPVMDFQVKFGSLKLEDREVFSVYHRKQGPPVILYKRDSELFVTQFEADGTIAKQDTLKILTRYETDQIRNEDSRNSSIFFWYDSFFAVSGTQAVRDRARQSDDRLREVFYLVKLKVD